MFVVLFITQLSTHIGQQIKEKVFSGQSQEINHHRLRWSLISAKQLRINSFWSVKMLSRFILVFTLLLFRRDESFRLAWGSFTSRESTLLAEALLSLIFGSTFFQKMGSLPFRSYMIRECSPIGEASLFCSMSLSWSWTCYSQGLKVVSETYLITGFIFLIRTDVLVNWLVFTSGILGNDSSSSIILRFLRFRWAARAYIYIYQIYQSAHSFIRCPNFPLTVNHFTLARREARGEIAQYYRWRLDRILKMEWKKQNKSPGCKAWVRTGLKKTSSVLDKQPKRRKQSKHKKILTEGVNSYLEAHLSATQDSLGRLQGSSIGEDGKTFVEKSISQFSKSYHTSSSSVLARQFDLIGQSFQAENERIRQVLKGLPARFQNAVSGYEEHREGLAEKIKKQNILLKSSFSLKPLR